MVYSGGLRRCLIIFAPHTLILDRRTCTCRAPSLQLLLQRSEYFTTSAAVAFTLSSPIMAERSSKPPAADMPGTSAELSTDRWPLHRVPLNEHQDKHNSIAASGQCFDIPWTSIQPTGCLRHTEFSTVTAMVDPGCEQGNCTALRL